MKNTKLIAWILVAVLCGGTVLAGCGNAEGTEESETVEATALMEEETLQEIGNPAATLEILLANEMGGVITELTVKSPSEAEYPDNMMAVDQEIKDGETIALFYEPVTKADFQSAEDEAENTDGDFEETPVTESTYSLRVTLENADVYELSDFDMEDMEEATLYLEDGVAYAEYISVSQNVLISTKEKELEIKEDKEAAQVVIDMIAAIGTVTDENAEEHKDEIEAAREAYDALTDTQKEYVTNIGLLEEMESILGSRSNEKKAVEESDGNAYDEGYYCGDNGYTKEDAEARAAELGYTSGSKSYQDFWDGYNEGYYGPYHTDGDNYAFGYSVGIEGYPEEEAQARLDADGATDPKSQYTKDFWNGYYAGYQEYNNVNSEKEDTSKNSGKDNYAWGNSLGAEGVDWSVAENEAINGGLVPNTQEYYDFSNGYDDGARDYWNNYYESEGIEIPGG